MVLTVGRQVDASVMPGFDRFFSFEWPSVVYALDIVPWDFCFGLALLLAAPVLVGTGIQRAIRIGLVLARASINAVSTGGGASWTSIALGGADH